MSTHIFKRPFAYSTLFASLIFSILVNFAYSCVCYPDPKINYESGVNWFVSYGNDRHNRVIYYSHFYEPENYLKDDYPPLTRLDNVNFDAFKVFSQNSYFSFEYAIDDQSVFYRGKRIKGADLHSFEVIPLNFSNNTCTSDVPMAQDRNYVYYRGMKTEQDRGSFTSIGNGYFSDKRQLYYLNQPLENSSVDVYKHEKTALLSNHQLYYRGEKMESGTNTFTHHQIYDINDFLCDRTIFPDLIQSDHALYLNDEKQKNVDIATFTRLNNHLFRDKDYYYGFDSFGERFIRLPFDANNMSVVTLKGQFADYSLFEREKTDTDQLDKIYILYDDQHWYISYPESPPIDLMSQDSDKIDPSTLQLISRTPNQVIFRTNDHQFTFENTYLYMGKKPL